MLLDKLLANLAVDVEPFALCLLSAGWRLRLPGPADVMIHFVLQGRGVVRGPDGEAHSVAPFWLVVVPPGTRHMLESGDAAKHERRIESPQPAGRIVAGSSDAPDLTLACGTVRVRYGPSLGLFDHLHEVLAVDLSVFPEARLAFEGILAETVNSYSHPPRIPTPRTVTRDSPGAWRSAGSSNSSRLGETPLLTQREAITNRGAAR